MRKTTYLPYNFQTDGEKTCSAEPHERFVRESAVSKGIYI